MRRYSIPHLVTPISSLQGFVRDNHVPFAAIQPTASCNLHPRYSKVHLELPPGILDIHVWDSRMHVFNRRETDCLEINGTDAFISRICMCWERFDLVRIIGSDILPGIIWQDQFSIWTLCLGLFYLLLMISTKTRHTARVFIVEFWILERCCRASERCCASQ